MSFYNAYYGCFHSLVNVHYAFKQRSFTEEFFVNNGRVSVCYDIGSYYLISV